MRRLLMIKIKCNIIRQSRRLRNGYHEQSVNRKKNSYFRVLAYEKWNVSTSNQFKKLNQPAQQQAQHKTFFKKTKKNYLISHKPFWFAGEEIPE